MSNKFFKTLSALLALAIIAVALIFSRQKFNPLSAYDDGIDNIDPDTIKLGGRVRVSFSDVILSKATRPESLWSMSRRAPSRSTWRIGLLSSWT